MNSNEKNIRWKGNLSCRRQMEVIVSLSDWGFRIEESKPALERMVG